MKKEKSEKKTAKWLIFAGAFVLVAALVTAALFLFVFDKEEAAPADIKLYWNVDGDVYRSREQIRMLDSDGYVYVSFACEGEQVRLPVIDIATATKIDMLEVMGLQFNEEGVITDCYRLEDFTGGIIANHYYVTAVEGGQVTCNSSVTMKGYDVKFEITENTGIWDVGTVGITCGIPGTVKVNDQIIAVRDPQGNVSDVFVISYMEPMDVYWNVDRMYDSASKSSTRQMDAAGGYTFLLACNGEQVTVRTRSMDVCQAMDAMAARCFGLEFDEDGYVTAVIHAGKATGGGSCASWHRVEMLREDHIRTFKVGSTATFSGTISKDVKIYDVSGSADFVGQEAELKVTDEVHCLRDSLGRVCVIFIVNRMADSEIYWNVDRKWDSGNAVSTRTPDKNGWYYVKVAVQGQQITVKTQDKAIVDSIDGRAAKCFGLKLNGDLIEKFYTPESVVGGGTFASWYDVTTYENGALSCYKVSNNDTRVGSLTNDCEIYNVSSTANVVGEKTELEVGDRIHALKNLKGEICVIFVVNRFYDYPTYYNLERKWDATKECTTRTPDENGYYVFEMAYKGKPVTVKTKSKSIANDIDSQAAKCVAMSVANGIVYKAVHPSNTVACKGGPTSSYTNVTALTSVGFNTTKTENGVVTKTYEETIATDCKVYNVSDNVVSHKGEPTTLKKGDFVHCLKNGNGDVCLVYVLTRYENLGVYYNLDRKWDDGAQATTRTPDAEGYYVFRMAHDGKEVTVKTKSVEVANAIDSQVAKVLGIQFDKNGLAIKAIHAKGTIECKGGVGVSYATVTKIQGNQVTTEKDGKLTTFPISAKPNVFDVSADAKVNQGERTQLRVGDFVHCLKNADGKTHYIYVMTRAVVLTEVSHTCQHVTGNVTWYEWNGKSSPGTSGHYVLTQDAQITETITIPKGVEVTICLNGHTVSSTNRIFKVYGTLNICDHKDTEGKYHGKLTSSYSNTLDDQGKVATKSYAALAYLYNTEASSKLNIYGGIFEHTGSLHTGGLIYIANSVKNEANTSVVNFYDGIMTGGTATSEGGAVFVSNLGAFNMYGGTITDCTANKGGALAINTAKGKITVNGGTIENCTSAGTGGAVQIDSGVMQMTGGSITGNTATGSGGGISLDGGQFLMSGGSLDGNTGAEGGNLRIAKAATVVLSKEALVCNGSATNGGNINTFGKLSIMDQAQVIGGKATSLGSAISVFSNYDDSQVEINIMGGTVDGDIRYTSKKGQSVKLNITGGTVDTVNVYNPVDATVVTEIFVGGTANVKNIYLAKGKQVKIHADGLNDTATVGISMGDPADPFAQITDEKDATCFFPVEDNVYKVENTDGKLYLVSKNPPHIHCACVGNAQDVGAHVCDEQTLWQPWLDDSSLPTSGNYYLTCNVELSTMVTLSGKTNLNLCLNGFTITGPGYEAYTGNTAKRVFLVRDADLTITDCGTTGTITNEAYSALNGGLIYLYSGDSTKYNSTFNLFGGKLTTTGMAKASGVVYIGNNAESDYIATVNMYGGSIENGKASGMGGNVVITNNCVLNLYGGTIRGGKAGGNGGNVTLSGGKLYLYGGLITEGEANGMGGGIYYGKEASNMLTVADKANVSGNVDSNLYVEAGRTIAVGADGLQKEALIGISLADATQVFATVTDDALASCFPSDSTEYVTMAENGELKFKIKPHNHCLCAGNGENLTVHTCDETLEWKPWNNDKALPTTSGCYYLMVDVSLSAMFEMKGKLDLKICLNDHTITGPGGGNRAFLLRDADLTITDCGTKGTITNQVTNTTNGGLIYQYSGSSCNQYNNSVNLYAGTLTVTGTAKSGGVLYLGNNMNANYHATFNMYGGTISGGSVADHGGNIQITNGCVFNLYGGTITGGAAGKNGGNIYLGSVQLNLLGGTVTGGTAGAVGNDIYGMSTITVGGNAQIGEIYLASGKTVSVSTDVALDAEASIGIAMDSTGKFATNVAESWMADCFASLDGWQKQYDAESKTLTFITE